MQAEQYLCFSKRIDIPRQNYAILFSLKLRLSGNQRAMTPVYLRTF